MTTPDPWDATLASAMAAVALSSTDADNIPSMEESMAALRHYAKSQTGVTHDADVIQECLRLTLWHLEVVSHRYGIHLGALLKELHVVPDLDWPETIADPNGARRRASKQAQLLKRLREAAAQAPPPQA